MTDYLLLKPNNNTYNSINTIEYRNYFVKFSKESYITFGWWKVDVSIDHFEFKTMANIGKRVRPLLIFNEVNHW
jgi:hypothetical protein